MLRPLGTGILVLAISLSGVAVRSAGADLVLTEVSGSADASATFFATSLPSRQDSATFGPFGGVAVAEVGPTRAVQTGSGFNAVNAEGLVSDVPSFSLRADTFVDMRVQNTGPGSEPLVFEYLINGGSLRLRSGNGFFEGLEATVAVSIFTIAPDFSGFLWEWGVTLRGTGTSAVADVHGFGPIFDFHDPLGLGQPLLSPVTVSGNEAMLSIAPFTATVDLGTLFASGFSNSATLTYSMYGQLSGPGFTSGGNATIGDPFDLTGNPGSVVRILGLSDPPNALPEPATLTLCVLGVAAVATLARRIRTHG